MKEAQINGKRAVGHAPVGMSYSYDDLMPKIIERITVGEYQHTKMCREIGMLVECNPASHGK